jgi:uncharacterized damage-inducible protein DinB
MNSHFAKMARYNAWANRRLYADARTLSDPDYRKNVGAFFGSLHGTLNHLMVADRIWMRRLTGTGDHPAKLNAIMFDDLSSLELARTQEDERIIRYVDELREAEIGQNLEYVTTNGVHQSTPVGDVLTHMFNHQTHHRGQAHTILTMLGIGEPHALDLMLMLREKA